ncbi:Phage integrase family protein [Anatilimnocola aggregata]|uniref:Phage integrase family protein n=1 Tax=Anatilimnocola aggregata TaxID=2528021 RepID=A0A517YAI0_9BACT|nr:tyrosine-type recombinase/integrase [Anatilimnocola aggregata]QDU27246.1 Phage integrase family protein [Anatilimnocola aggregata]
MGRKRKVRRQQHGSVWHWKQTDAWYYTLPGTKKRMPLFDEQGERIKGLARRDGAERAFAKIKVTLADNGPGYVPEGEWIVARVCSDYLQYCERGVSKATTSAGHHRSAKMWLNDLCAYCGALPVSQLKKGHITTWIESHSSWRSTETHRGVLSIVLAAFNRTEEMFGVANPLKGLKKPTPKPRLQSISPDDEQVIYDNLEPQFRNFLFAAVHTGLRPFCELAQLKAEHIEQTPRGMMWRVYSSKTKKTRKIPVRPEVAQLATQLLKDAPPGSNLPLFRNTKGGQWKRMTGVVRFGNLRKKLKWDQDPVRSKYTCYTCRHTFVHRMLSGYWTNGVGCSIETVAELIGDTPKVAFDHYGREWGQHYQAPLWAAIGEQPKPQNIPKPKGTKAGKKVRA